MTTIEAKTTTTDVETTTTTEVKTTVPIKINHDKDFGKQKPLSPALSRPEDVSEDGMGGCPKSEFENIPNFWLFRKSFRWTGQVWKIIFELFLVVSRLG